LTGKFVRIKTCSIAYLLTDAHLVTGANIAQLIN